jgi:hypothetical protein
MVALTAQTHNSRSRISLSVGLPASLVDGPAHESFKDEVGGVFPTQDRKLFLLVGPE